MKKTLTTILLSVLISGPLYAAKGNTRVFGIYYANEGYYYFNDAENGTDFRVYVDELINGKAPDKVTMLCNGSEQYLTPGAWTTCHAKFRKVLTLIIPEKDFHNGASGVVVRA